MGVLRRIDQAISPSGWIRGPVANSLFLTDDGVYVLATGRGWSMNVRMGHRNQLNIDAVGRAQDAIDASDLAGEVARRSHSTFVAIGDLDDVEVAQRFGASWELRYVAGDQTHRFRFEAERGDEVAAFAATLRVASSAGGSRSFVQFEGEIIRTVALPSPCWGATPHLVADDRPDHGGLYVEYIGPTGMVHDGLSNVYRASDEEQTRFLRGRFDVAERCRRLVGDAWGAPPPTATIGDPLPAVITARLPDTRERVAHAIEARSKQLATATADLGRGGSAEQTARHERVRQLEIDLEVLDRMVRWIPAA